MIGITSEPHIAVGIVTAPRLTVTYITGFGAFDGKTVTYTAADAPLTVEPDGEGLFELHDVVIGVGFHWQRNERQRFTGALRIQCDAPGLVTAVNLVLLESYLCSVISSEMSANASVNLLRAHAVTSRSWLLFQLHGHTPAVSDACDTPDRLIRWYDREAHTTFDVCADDHCQRYQGVTRQTTPAVARAVADTRGEVLTYDGEICDARFSKCCGGRTESFGTCWQPADIPYLRVFDDPWCGKADSRVLAQVLNSYDRDTTGYYRWTVRYTPDELRDIIRARSGTDYGDIIALEPVLRGPGGRIRELRIRGTKLTRVIGKELEIRRTLSRSHLYSSDFEVSRDSDGAWVIDGKGWGHGVGLCQIGAAVMGDRGIDYRDILDFYFSPARITSLY